MQKSGKLLDTSEIAKRLNYSQREMQEWCRQGKFKTARKVGRKWRVNENEVKTILDNKHESFDQSDIQQALPEKIVLEISTLAKTLEWLIDTPAPKTELLDYSRMSEKTKEVVNQLVEGHSAGPAALLLVTSYRTPWWCNDRQRKISISLSLQQEPLFKRFLALQSSYQFKEALEDWRLKANKYLDQVRSSGETDKMNKAYQETKQAETIAHKELWEAVENLRWQG